MTTRRSNWLPLILLLLLAGLTFWLSRAVLDAPNKGDTTLRHDPDMTVENFTATQFGEDGLVRYTLAARKMVHYPDDDTSHLTEVRYKASETGDPLVTVTSDTARLTQKGDEVFLRGNVVMTRAAGPDAAEITIRTAFLHIIPDQGIAKTDQPVEIREAATVINAGSLFANNKAATITLTRVHARYANPQ